MKKVIATYLVEYQGNIVELRELKNGEIYMVLYQLNGAIKFINIDREEFFELIN